MSVLDVVALASASPFGCSGCSGTCPLINKTEMAAQITALQEAIQEQDRSYSAEIDVLKGRMTAKVSAIQKEMQELGLNQAKPDSRFLARAAVDTSGR